MMKILESLDSIKCQYDAVTKAINDIRGQQKRLRAMGIQYGSPSYKAGKYLRIVRPAADGHPRQFEYVGADPDKQDAALKAIARGQEYDALGKRAADLEESLKNLESDLSYLVRRFEWSHNLNSLK